MATWDTNKRENKSTDVEFRFLRSSTCRPIFLTERAVQLKLAQNVYGRRRSKKNLEGLYEVLAPSSNIIKVSLTTSTIKEPRKAVVTVRNSDIAKFGTLQERQTLLKVYADKRGPRTCEKLVDGKIQSHVKQFTRILKGDKKMKLRRRESGSGVSSSRSNISRARRGRILKIPNSAATRNQRNAEHVKRTGTTPTIIFLVSPTISRPRTPCNAEQTRLGQKPP